MALHMQSSGRQILHTNQSEVRKKERERDTGSGSSVVYSRNIIIYNLS